MLYVVATCKPLFFIFLFLKIIKTWVKNWVATTGSNGCWTHVVVLLYIYFEYFTKYKENFTNTCIKQIPLGTLKLPECHCIRKRLKYP